MASDNIPEMDIDYLDQLLTTYIPPEERTAESDPAETPAEVPAEVTPEEPKEVPAPPQKAQFSAGRALLLSIAAILLLTAGFLAGRAFPAQQDAPTETTTSTAPTGLTAPPSFGSIPSYSFMSTAELAVQACKIQELIDLFHTDTLFTPDLYEALEKKYPLLTELKKRQDVLPILENIAQTSTGTGEFGAARLLISYFTQYVYVPVTPDTDSIDPDIAVDYVSMSTKELVGIALQISELSLYGSPYTSIVLTPDIYRDIAARNPVLLELQQRPDAVEVLTHTIFLSSDLSRAQIANTLTRYFTAYPA